MFLVCVGVALLVIGACEKDRPPLSAPAAPRGLARSQTIQTVKGSHHLRLAEQQVVQLANEIPGLAGYYIDGANGQLVAYVKDTGQGTRRAAAALQAHLVADGLGIPMRQRPYRVLIKLADYDFQTLSDYRDFITDSLLGAPGVVSDGINHALNRVTVGVKDANAQAFVLNQLRQHGIPAGAMHFESASDFKVLTAPSSRSISSARRRYGSVLESNVIDTVAGGLMFEDFTNGHGCTIGVVVDSGANRRFLTASHCTLNMFEVDGDAARAEGDSLIGVETADPAGARTCTGIPITCWYHRSSDAALFTACCTPSRKGVIARPNTRSPIVFGAARDTSINSANPWLFVSGTVPASALATGETIDHIGGRSGWSYGTISDPCSDFIVTSSIKIYCEVKSDNIGARAGDSGGPMFLYDGYDGAVLAGTLTGNQGGDSSTYVYDTTTYKVYSRIFFSPWSGNVYDLGPVDPLNNTTVGTPSLTGSVSDSNAVASWSAVSTTNTSDATQYDIWEWEWDASTQTWWENEAYIGRITGLSYSDVSAPWGIAASVGASMPDMCNYSSVGINIRAYNRGVSAYASTIWFRGPKNGSGPAC
jgi:hypothetical protein